MTTTYSSPFKQVEGVGQGALAAAALHTDFDLDKVAPWPGGAEVPFSYLAAAFEAIGKDSRRLAKTQQLVALFRGIIARTPEDLLPAVCLLSEHLAGTVSEDIAPQLSPGMAGRVNGVVRCCARPNRETAVPEGQATKI